LQEKLELIEKKLENFDILESAPSSENQTRHYDHYFVIFN
jgi:hypothetical protein